MSESALEVRRTEYTRITIYSRSRSFVTLTDCPACGYDYDDEEDRSEHLEGHTPEDFGLSQLGDRPDSNDRERDAAVTVTLGPSDLSPSDARELIAAEERDRSD